VFGNRETGGGRNSADRITDFSQEQNDRIALGGVDADSTTDANERFTWIGQQRFSGEAGELRFSHIGGDTFVSGDLDGDTKTDFVIQLDGMIDLTAADFKL
jgi:hypothetical protein